jgi:ATP-binding cassette subfamily F protein 3
MLPVQGLQKGYGAATVLAGIDFVVDDREHVGLIGPNGAGKSTLLRCIAGRETTDAGVVVFSPQNAQLRYLPQSCGKPLSRSLVWCGPSLHVGDLK